MSTAPVAALLTRSNGAGVCGDGNSGYGVRGRSTAGKYGSNKIRIVPTKAATKVATVAYFIFAP